MEKVILSERFERYGAYKDSGVEWIGEVPEGWVMKPNKHIFKLKKEVVGKKASDFDLLSLTLNGIIKRDMENPQGKFPAEFDTYQVVKEGNFVFCLFDVEETPRTVGLSTHFGMITGAYTVLEVRDGIDQNFLYYYYLNLDSRKGLKFLYKGLRNTIPKDVFFSFKTLLPPLPEQKAIANFLDRKCAQIDKAIAQKERLIELLKERQQVIIQRAVTKGLDSGVKMKDSGVEWIGEVPEGWEVVRLKYLVKIQGGLTLGKQYNKGLVKIPYLRVANVQAGYLDLESITGIEIPTNDINKHLLQKGDILVTEGGDIDKLGRGTIWNGEISPCIHQNHIFSVRVIDDSALPEFISYLLESEYGRRYFIETATKTTNLASTNRTKLGEFPLALPKKGVQEEILTYLNLATKKIKIATHRQKRQIDMLNEYKSILIDNAVTGKIKVK